MDEPEFRSSRSQGGGSGTVLKTKDANNSVRRLPIPDGQHSATVSFTLIWLATTALQVITAPLVEPRYFILPWIFWRLHVPLRLPPATAVEDVPAQQKRGAVSRSLRARWWEEYDHRLWLETAWLVAVNVGTGWVFLKWGFVWAQEPGKVQRFMW